MLKNNKKQSFFFNFYQTILRPDYINNDKIFSPMYTKKEFSIKIFSNFGVSTFEDLKIFRILKLFFIFSGQKLKYSSFSSLKKERNTGGIFLGKNFKGKNLYYFLDFLYFIFFPRLVEKYIIYKFELTHNFFFRLNDLSGFTYLVDDIFKSSFSLFIKSDINNLNKNHNNIINIFLISLLKKYLKK